MEEEKNLENQNKLTNEEIEQFVRENVEKYKSRFPFFNDKIVFNGSSADANAYDKNRWGFYGNFVMRIINSSDVLKRNLRDSGYDNETIIGIELSEMIEYGVFILFSKVREHFDKSKGQKFVAFAEEVIKNALYDNFIVPRIKDSKSNAVRWMKGSKNYEKAMIIINHIKALSNEKIAEKFDLVDITSAKKEDLCSLVMRNKYIKNGCKTYKKSESGYIISYSTQKKEPEEIPYNSDKGKELLMIEEELSKMPDEELWDIVASLTKKFFVPSKREQYEKKLICSALECNGYYIQKTNKMTFIEVQYGIQKDSLDKPITSDEEEDITLGDTISDRHAEVEENFYRNYLIKILYEIIYSDALTEEERIIALQMSTNRDLEDIILEEKDRLDMENKKGKINLREIDTIKKKDIIKKLGEAFVIDYGINNLSDLKW